MVKDALKIVKVKDIPYLATEAEEQAYWDTHEMDASEFSKDNKPLLPLPLKVSKSVSMRLESDTLKRLKNLAKHKGMGYQTLLKQFMLERLYEEEKRLEKSQ